MPETQVAPATVPRGLVGAVVAIVCAVLLVGALWLVAREAPSAGRDPQMTPLALVPTRVPTPAPDAEPLDVEQ